MSQYVSVQHYTVKILFLIREKVIQAGVLQEEPVLCRGHADAVQVKRWWQREMTRVSVGQVYKESVDFGSFTYVHHREQVIWPLYN